MGMHARALVARHRRLSRDCSAGRILCVRRGRRAPSRVACAAPDRPGQWRARKARRRAGRNSPPVSQARWRISRPGALVVAQRRLGPPLDINRVAGPLMKRLSIASRMSAASISTRRIATAIALASREHVTPICQTNFQWSAQSYFIGAGLVALAASVLIHTGYWIAPLGFAPVYLTYRTYKVYMGRIEDEQQHIQQTSDLHLATIEALARAIDAKDQNTQMHIRRVQMYAAGLATTVGLSPPPIQGGKTAALLHDIGKLAVPEHILSKPGPLTQ